MPMRFAMTESHLEAFAERQRERFEDEMVVHLGKEYPSVSDKMGAPWMRELIREGMKLARGYHLMLEREVARYIELMVAVSPSFDDSPKTPWAKPILTDKQPTGREKIDRLYEHILFGPDAARSPGNKNTDPRPLHPQAAAVAWDKVWSSHPELQGRRLTLEPRDETYRRAWMSAYHEAMVDLEVPPPTSRPDIEVGEPTGPEFAPRTGTLTVTVVGEGDARAGRRGSVVLTGTECRSAVTDAANTATFRNLALGRYRILTACPGSGAGQAEVTVGAGETSLSVVCHRA